MAKTFTVALVLFVLFLGAASASATYSNILAPMDAETAPEPASEYTPDQKLNTEIPIVGIAPADPSDQPDEKSTQESLTANLVAGPAVGIVPTAQNQQQTTSYTPTDEEKAREIFNGLPDSLNDFGKTMGNVVKTRVFWDATGHHWVFFDLDKDGWFTATYYVYINGKLEPSYDNIWGLMRNDVFSGAVGEYKSENFFWGILKEDYWQGNNLHNGMAWGQFKDFKV